MLYKDLWAFVTLSTPPFITSSACCTKICGPLSPFQHHHSSHPQHAVQWWMKLWPVHSGTQTDIGLRPKTAQNFKCCAAVQGCWFKHVCMLHPRVHVSTHGHAGSGVWHRSAVLAFFLCGLQITVLVAWVLRSQFYRGGVRGLGGGGDGSCTTPEYRSISKIFGHELVNRLNFKDIQVVLSKE